MLLAVFRLGHNEEGARYLRFLLHACATDPAGSTEAPHAWAADRGPTGR